MTVETGTQETSTKDQTPEFIQKLGDVRGMLMVEKVPVSEQWEQYQRALHGIWDVCSAYFRLPNSQMINVNTLVSSARLKELGLLSPATSEKINGTPPSSTTGNIVEGTEINVNIIKITKTAEGFMIEELYHNIVETSKTDKGNILREDCHVQETTRLKRSENGELEAEIKLRTFNEHHHYKGKIWPDGSNEVKEEYPPKDEAKCINTTLALLVESAAPGYIK